MAPTTTAPTMTAPTMTAPKTTDQTTDMTQTLRVNPINCTGHGVCAELLPELVSLDEWGYPLVDPRPVPATLERDARRAVAACPALALKLLRTS